jgi:hypothetical protein
VSGTSNPRDTFASVNASLAPCDRLQKIGELTEPIAADIYCLPE